MFRIAFQSTEPTEGHVLQVLFSTGYDFDLMRGANDVSVNVSLRYCIYVSIA